MELTKEQEIALRHLVTNIRKNKKNIQTLGGLAGTGKTTLINYLSKFFPDYAVCAYTGKASNVLRKKGLRNSSTIHSRIYIPQFTDGMVYFDINPSIDCEGFIVDEASMCSEAIYNDLLSFKLPIVFVGDHGQLEPVDSNFNLMKSPDYTLEQIHRNAGSIAKFAHHLRKGFTSRSYKTPDSKIRLYKKYQVDDNLILSADQIICAFNKTRVEVNQRIRKLNKFTGVLNVGEKVMCLKNNALLSLFNGMQGIVTKLWKKEIEII